MLSTSMISLQRRYWDKLARYYQRQMNISIDDFHYGPQIPGESKLRLLPEISSGQRALELGCGAAQNSIWLAKQGLECVAIDISQRQLDCAMELAREAGVEFETICSPLEELANDVVSGSFDFIHSSHAFEFVDSPGEVIKAAAKLLAPGGFLVISTVHPLYNGEWVESLDQNGAGGGMGLFLRDYFNPPDDIRYRNGKIEAISRSYAISRWCEWLRQAGLHLVRLAEPPAVDDGADTPYTSRAWAHHEGQLHAIPGTLILVAGSAASR